MAFLPSFRRDCVRDRADRMRLRAGRGQPIGGHFVIRGYGRIKFLRDAQRQHGASSLPRHSCTLPCSLQLSIENRKRSSYMNSGVPVSASTLPSIIEHLALCTPWTILSFTNPPRIASLVCQVHAHLQMYLEHLVHLFPFAKRHQCSINGTIFRKMI